MKTTMRITMKHRTIVSLLLIFSTVMVSYAQPLREVTLPKVEKDGYYEIKLSESIIGAARADLSDLRIRSNNADVAYFITPNNHTATGEYLTYPFRVSHNGNNTEIIIETSGEISSFDIKIKNAVINKKVKISGSDDAENWYLVDDYAVLVGGNSKNTVENLSLEFPVSDYKYYRLAINDSLSSPLNVISIGKNLSSNIISEELLPVTITKQTISISGKNSEIELVFPFKHRIEQLNFEINKPTFFDREIRIGKYNTHRLTGKSGESLSVKCHEISDTMKITIFNGDDVALDVKSITALIQNRSIVAYLAKNNDYKLTFDDSNATIPIYDLAFKAQIDNTNLETITTDNLTVITTPKPKVAANWFDNFWSYSIWIVIVFVLIQILLLVRKLMRKN